MKKISQPTDEFLRFTLEPKDLEDVIKQIKNKAGQTPVIFVEKSISDKQVELTIIIASLTQTLKEELQQLSNDLVSTRKIEGGNFNSSFSFKLPKKN